MYEFLDGEVVARSAGRLVLAVGGVGYDLRVPVGDRFDPTPGEPLRVYTHLAVREDAHTLYGFAESSSRELFRLLLKVKKVGPGVALAILSSMRREELLAAIRDGDAAQLTRCKGVGRKTAEQILLDLSDRIGELAGQVAPARPVGAKPAAGDAAADAALALQHIGFDPREAEDAVRAVAGEQPGADAETLIKLALKRGARVAGAGR